MNNINFRPISHCLPGIAQNCQIIVFDKGVPLVNDSFSVISANIAIIHNMLPKLDSFEHILVGDSMGLHNQADVGLLQNVTRSV